MPKPHRQPGMWWWRWTGPAAGSQSEPGSPTLWSEPEPTLEWLVMFWACKPTAPTLATWMLPSSLQSTTIHYSTCFLTHFQSFFNMWASPVPVAAQAHRSRPRRPTGTQAFWIGVGCLKPRAVIACRYRRDTLSSISFHVAQVPNNPLKNLQTFPPRHCY